MSLPNVNITQSTSGLGAGLAGTDYVSGLLFYTNTLPSGFSSSDRIKKIFSVADAEALGITDNQQGATAATGTITITNKGAVGDTAVVTVATTTGTVTIASYTLVSADITTTTTSASALAAAINAGTATHGFSASPAVAVVTITAPKTEGVYLNTVSAVFTPTGILAATVVAFSAGVGSIVDILYYHISEYFRIQPKGELWVGLYAEESSTYTFTALTTLQNYAQGAIKQVGIYQANVAFATNQTTTIQALVTALEALYKPLQVVYNAEISATASVASLTTLATLTNPNVSVCIAQDGAGDGSILYKAYGKSVGAIGALLGTISLAAVNESIAWVGKFQVATTELDTIAFSNGQLYSALADSQFESLNNYHYIFLRKLVGIEGSYWSDSPTCVASTSDYSVIEINRVYQKLERNVRSALLPLTSSPITVSADGTLSLATIGYFSSVANTPVQLMQNAGEISAHKVIIDPAQDVLATSTIAITIQNVPTGVARNINVKLGFVKSV